MHPHPRSPKWFLLTAVSVSLLLAAPGSAVAQSAEAQQTSSSERILLIARGDDFGYIHASNVGMKEAFEKGIMTAGSFIVTGPWFPETAKLVMEHPNWSTGVHITLTSTWNHIRWKPVLPTSEVPSLVGPDGYMYAGGHFRRPDAVRQLPAYDLTLWAESPPDHGEVEREARAQIETARSYGIRIDHLDCHEGVICHPQLFPILVKLGEEYCLPIGNMGRLGETGAGPHWTPPTAIGITNGEMVKAGIIEWLETIGPGLWFTVSHPVVDGPELRAISDWEPATVPFFLMNVHSHEAWTSPEVAEVIRRRGIELVSYRDLWDYEKCAPKPLAEVRGRRFH